MFMGVGLQYIHIIHVHPIGCVVQCDSRVGPAEESSHLKYNGRKPFVVPGLLHIPFCRYTYS